MSYLPLKLENPVPSDLEIAKKQIPKDIKQLADEIHVQNNELELYGTKKAKIKLNMKKKRDILLLDHWSIIGQKKKKEKDQRVFSSIS